MVAMLSLLLGGGQLSIHFMEKNIVTNPGDIVRPIRAFRRPKKVE